MKKSLLAFCLAMATLSLSAQEVLDFSQPDPVSATPVRSTKLFRYTCNAQAGFGFVPSYGMEMSVSLMGLGCEIRPWRNRHYFSTGLTLQYVDSDLSSFHYAISGNALSFNEVKNGSLYMDRAGFAVPLTYGFDIGKRKSLEFSVIANYWEWMKLTNVYKGGEQYEYAKAQGLVQDGYTSTMGSYYGGFNRFTVDFSVAYYPWTNAGFSLKYTPSMLFKKGNGPSYPIFSYSFIVRF